MLQNLYFRSRALKEELNVRSVGYITLRRSSKCFTAYYNLDHHHNYHQHRGK